MRPILLFSLSAIGGGLMLAAQTPFDDARSNLETWIRALVFSTDSLPTTYDTEIFILGAILLTIGLSLTVWNFWFRKPAIPPSQTYSPEKIVSILSTKRLSCVSNEDLRSDVARLSARLRSFQAKLNDMGRKSYTKQTAGLLEGHEKARATFDQSLRPDAVALRDELHRRLEIFDYDEWEQPAFRGMLAGPTPASDAADYLEKLARDLP